MSLHRALLTSDLTHRWLVAWVIIGLAPGLIPTQLAANSAEDFFRPARISKVKLSPDGQTIAGLAPIGKSNEMGLVFMDVDSLEHRAFKWSGGHDITDVSWVAEDQVVFNVVKWGMYAAGLYRANRKGRDIETLLDERIAVSLVDPMVTDPRHAKIWIQDEYEGKPSLALLLKNASGMPRSGGNRTFENQNNMEGREVLPPGETFRVYTDHTYTTRILANARNGRIRYLHRENRKEPWTPLELDPTEWRIINFDSDNRSLYVTGYDGEQTRGLYLYNLDTKSMSEPLLRDEEYDFDVGGIFKFVQDSLVGVTYHKGQPVSEWFSEGLANLQAFVDKSLPDRTNIIFDWSEDFSRILILTESPQSPPSYVTLDLRSKEFKLISNAAPWIDQSTLSPSQSIKFKTTDGLRLEGYITLPKNGKPPYPAVNLVHGGPWVRDVGGFDAEAQFLASLGYAVVQVNYRGSSGYGIIVSEIPAYDFRAMHDDITRATELLIKQGIVDENRVAIMGASFGGFAALAGAAFEPDLYQCAVTNVGVFDWAEMVRARKRQDMHYNHSRLVEELGDPKNQNAYLDISPINHVDKIKIPIFIAHGKADNNVSVKQSRQLERALRKQGVPHETYYREWQGHGFRGKTRIEFYERVAAFLAEHIDGG